MAPSACVVAKVLAVKAMTTAKAPATAEWPDGMPKGSPELDAAVRSGQWPKSMS
jgi:hypothetical protein